MTKLRFAPLIRVSTEKQAVMGESLRTQKTQIETAVEHLGGIITTWDYCGQEHATGAQRHPSTNSLCSPGSLSKSWRCNRRSASVGLLTDDFDQEAFFALAVELVVEDVFPGAEV